MGFLLLYLLCGGKGANESLGMNNIVLKKEVLEEIKDVVVEGETNAKLELLVAYHRAGEIIIENNLSAATVANYIGRSERTVEYMVKFASKFKSVTDVPGDKIISWHSVVRDHLTTTKKEHEHDFKMRCTCGAVGVYVDPGVPDSEVFTLNE